MRKFSFRYQALLKLRVARRDRCRQLLAGLFNDERALAAQQSDIEKQRQGQLDELRNLVSAGTVDVDRTIARRYYAGRLAGEIFAVHRSRALVARQIEQCRTALARADREVKVLEKLREKQLAEYAYELNRREIRELDETWIAGQIGEHSR